jgi:hypothetical protein
VSIALLARFEILRVPDRLIHCHGLKINSDGMFFLQSGPIGKIPCDVKSCFANSGGVNNVANDVSATM